MLRDPVFGVAEPFAPPLLKMSGNGLLVSAVTWGAIIIELVIVALLIGPERWRKLVFCLDVLLYGAVIASIGLWSFAPVMTGSAAVAAPPGRVELMDRVEPTARVPHKAGDAGETESRQRTRQRTGPHPPPRLKERHT
ncbi:hypothetical protein [Streptomyces sp. NPDC058308]|uniref:hypothetical protein n=1 Tax=Streptomyces sp. NPDC058308 TaxID=3346440 RepID=UPI0036E2532E